MKKAVTIGLLLISALIGATLAAYYLSIPNTGNIIAPANITATPSSLDWGAITQGTEEWRLVTLTNNGGTPTTLTPDSITYNAETYLTLNSNITADYILNPSASVCVNFTLTVDPTAPIGSFNFNIDITGA